jgi:hypothetical protein
MSSSPTLTVPSSGHHIAKSIAACLRPDVLTAHIGAKNVP